MKRSILILIIATAAFAGSALAQAPERGQGQGRGGGRGGRGGGLPPAPTLTGPWTTLGVSNSPFVAPMSGARFYRLRR